MNYSEKQPFNCQSTFMQLELNSWILLFSAAQKLIAKTRDLYYEASLITYAGYCYLALVSPTTGFGLRVT